eukprot:3649478-Rhodomonas_salina.3
MSMCIAASGSRCRSLIPRTRHTGLRKPSPERLGVPRSSPDRGGRSHHGILQDLGRCLRLPALLHSEFVTVCVAGLRRAFNAENILTRSKRAVDAGQLGRQQLPGSVCVVDDGSSVQLFRRVVKGDPEGGSMIRVHGKLVGAAQPDGNVVFGDQRASIGPEQRCACRELKPTSNPCCKPLLMLLQSVDSQACYGSRINANVFQVTSTDHYAVPVAGDRDCVAFWSISSLSTS